MNYKVGTLLQPCMKYRSRTDIITAILNVAAPGATKTRIMYGAYLSYAQVREYLDFLLSKKLLVYDEAGTYRLTEDGMKLLRPFEGISQVLAVIQQPQQPGATEHHLTGSIPPAQSQWLA